MKLRRGCKADVPQLLDVKHSRRLSEQTGGGFLLGSDAAGYLQQLEQGNVWVLDSGGQLAGFATTLGDAAFRASPLFAFKDSLVGSLDVAATLAQPLGYFDQLAVRRGVSSRAAARLAFTALWDMFTQGARCIVTTTVAAPIRNLASVPFIERIGGRAVGQVTETHPEIGNLASTVWLFTSDDAMQYLKKESRFVRFLLTTSGTSDIKRLLL